MDGEIYQNPRRKLSFSDTHHSQYPSFTPVYSHNHSSNYLQLAINNFNQLIKESDQEIFDEQQLIINEENKKLNKIQNFQNEINHIQTNIDSLNNEIDKLTANTYDMLVKQNEGALIRHHQLLKESIEYINHVLRKRLIVNDSSLEQLKKELTNQQEKLFLIRNQLDIDHNQLTTNMSLLKECQEQRKQSEQMKLKKQVDLQNIQQIQIDYIQKQLKLQKLQSSIEQQVRVRNEIQQLQRYLEPKKYHKPSKIYETKQELDLTKDRLLEIVNEMDEETIETSGNHLQKQDQTYNYSFNKFKDYRTDKNNE